MATAKTDMVASTKVADWSYGGNNAFHNFYNDYSHIADPNLRRRLALSEIDKIPFGWYHVRAVVVAGVGFFLDSYDIFAINLVTGLLGLVFWGGTSVENGIGGNNGHLPGPINQALKASTSGGIVIGMLVFGRLADTFGRRKMYGVELGIVLVATLSCALASGSPAISTAGLLIFWRVLMGVGIGADYPLSSVITSEFAPTRWRGAMIAAVFSMQGLGQLTAALVALITTVAFKDSFINITNESQCDEACRIAADRAWRIIVGVGAVPACLALYYRVTIPETPRFTFDVDHDIEKADADIKAYMSSKAKGEFDRVQQIRLKKLAGPSLNIPNASWSDVGSFFGKWRNTKMLIGTTMSWFFLDLAFYGMGLNTDVILQAIGYDNDNSIYRRLYDQAVGMIILTCAGSLPGYWTAVFTVDTIGRKPLQIFGFVLLTVLFCIIGFAYHHLGQTAKIVLLVITQFVFNAGPNTTTFLIPGECFPTRYRSTGHGLSAAMGKIGAILAQGISIPVLNHGAPANCTGSACSPNLNRLVQLFAIFMLLGTFVSFLVPETKGVTLEELSGERPTGLAADGRGSEGGKPPRNSWNPFVGGQPAGFSQSRLSKSRFTNKNKPNSPRIGIMTPMEDLSPELQPQRQQQQQQQQIPSRQTSQRIKTPRFNRRNRGSISNSHTSTDIPLSVRSSGSGPGERERDERDDYFSHHPRLPPPAMRDQTTQAWSAGWGKVERRLSDADSDVQADFQARLRDIGMLLNSPR